MIPMAFISFSCDEAIELPSPDLTPPNAFFIKPFDGESVSGISKIQVRSTDNEGMEAVVFIINQDLVSKRRRDLLPPASVIPPPKHPISPIKNSSYELVIVSKRDPSGLISF